MDPLEYAGANVEIEYLDDDDDSDAEDVAESIHSHSPGNASQEAMLACSSNVTEGENIETDYMEVNYDADDDVDESSQLLSPGNNTTVSMFSSSSSTKENIKRVKKTYKKNGNPSRVELNINIRDILYNSLDGRSVLESYEKTNMLTPANRTVVVHKAVEIYIKNLQSISVAMCRELAHKIIETFPTECIYTYFSQNETNRPPKGKLWDRYQGRKKALQKINLFMSKQRLQKKEKPVEINEGMESLRIALQHPKSWPSVKKNWRATSQYRKMTLTNDFTKTLELWPLYADPKVLELINIDYNHSFEHNNFNYSNWNLFTEKFERLFAQYIKEKYAKNLLEMTIKNKNKMTNDMLAISIFKMMHYALKPNTYYKNAQKRRKVTAEESEKAFGKEVRKISDYKHKSDEISMVVVGHDSFQCSYVFFGKSKLKFDKFLDSIIFMFKLVKTTNLEFPYECANVWSFIETFLFGFEVETEKPNLKTFLNDLKAYVK